jgi:hypothetical protein
MENLRSFLKGCRDVGLPEHSLFQVDDLLPGRKDNFDAVVLSLKALRRMFIG